jgi:hypothetical protein
MPGAPEVEVWRHQTLPLCLPEVHRRGTPITESATLQVPEDGGELFVVMGSSVPVQARPGDRMSLLIRRVG